MSIYSLFYIVGKTDLIQIVFLPIYISIWSVPTLHYKSFDPESAILYKY